MRGNRWRVALVIAVAAGVIVAYGAGRLARHLGVSPPAAWAADAPTLTATASKVDNDGVVRINGMEVARLRSSAGGLSPYERAMIFANRLNNAFASGAGPDDVHAGVVQGMNVVLFKDKALITADSGQANAENKDRAQIAEEWAASIRTAMRKGLGLPEPQVQPASNQTSSEVTTNRNGQGSEPDWTPAEPYDKKIVPILSVGEGIQVGAAQVDGPKSRVAEVQAVGLLEARFQSFLNIELYVPISTRQPGKTLSRVQGVGVVGVAMYKVTGG